MRIEKKADLEALLGKHLTDRLLRAVRTGHMKRLPSSVSFSKIKPQFALGDGDTLDVYGVNLREGVVTGSRFCGSGDTVLNHAAEQLGEGEINTPVDHAAAFVHSYWNGRNMSWTLLLVSKDGFMNIPGGF